MRVILITSFFFFKIILALVESVNCHINFRITWRCLQLSCWDIDGDYIKSPGDTEENGHLYSFSLLIHEYNLNMAILFIYIFFYLLYQDFVIFIVHTRHVLTILPKYFVSVRMIINGIILLISVSACLFLVLCVGLLFCDITECTY